MIYSIDGTPLQDAYGLDGQALSAAYAIDGTQIFPSSFPLKVMTYNVGQWYYGSGDNVPANEDEFFYALQNGMIQQDDPDVLCLQEYWKVFSKTGRTALSMLQQYFPYIHEEGGNSGYFGRCICSKYPISNYTIRTYTAESSRYYDSCIVTVHGVPITFVNTHLATTQANRDLENPELIAYVQSLSRFVLCGDFNTEIIYNTASVEDERYIENVKPYLDAGLNSANFIPPHFLMTCINWVNGNHLCLDNIYTSAGITVDSAYVDDAKLDALPENRVDHMPLIAELTIN